MGQPAYLLHAVFVVASVLHILLNGKALLSYFSANVKSAGRFRLEWIAALILCGIVWWGSLKPFVPFSALLDLNEQMKRSQPPSATQPPVPHAELLTIAELAKQAEVDTETILQNLRSRNIEASEADIFGDIAERENLSPNELYGIAIGQPSSGSSKGRQQGGQQHRGETSGGGFGSENACAGMRRNGSFARVGDGTFTGRRHRSVTGTDAANDRR